MPMAIQKLFRLKKHFMPVVPMILEHGDRDHLDPDRTPVLIILSALESSS
jgi:hypothetical protein